MVPEEHHDGGLVALPQGVGQGPQGLVRPGDALQHDPDDGHVLLPQGLAGDADLARVVELLRVKGLVVLHGDGIEEGPLPAVVDGLHPVQDPLEQIGVPHVIAAVDRVLDAKLLDVRREQQIGEAQHGVGHRPVVEAVVVAVEHLRPVAVPGVLLRQGVEPLVEVVLQEADVGAGAEVQPRDAVEHGHLQIPGAVAQVVAVEGAGDALAL